MSADKIIDWISTDLSLPDIGVRNISDKLQYYVELQTRKESILSSIQEQKKLTVELKKQIELCKGKTKLEDIYLPYKPKRQTKATIAKANGLEALAVEILSQKLSMKENRDSIVNKYLNPKKGIDTIEKAVSGA
ncbi:MAG: hypothetical protein LBG23_04250 [Endomicrobium sp.]|jgi:uncharacterized protein|nr:hypothetical protein [Endomicrobium sp.]